MAAAARALANRPLLKVKIGRERVVERVAGVRTAAPKARLIVDANEGWDRAFLDQVCGPLAKLNVDLIEQPLPASADADLSGYSGEIPLAADESIHTVSDLDRLADAYRVVNVKLDKAGGLTEALALAAAVRARGLDLMIGCMVCSSLGVAPALLLAAGANWVDLDGPLWLASDRQPPLKIADGVIGPAEPALWG
jgi:L-alanine-DL-glutamate epimerase-like enolase superfamily enzyme